MSATADPLDIVSYFERKLLSSPGGNGILKIVLFGSRAKGTAQPKSDIDVLVVAGRESESREAVADAAFEAQTRQAAAIEPVLMSVDELFPVTSYFLRNALENGKEVFTVSDIELRDQERRNLLDLADEYLAGADAIFAQGLWRVAADAAYHAAELAVKALILKHDSDLPGSHGGVVGRFGSCSLRRRNTIASSAATSTKPWRRETAPATKWTPTSGARMRKTCDPSGGSCLRWRAAN